MPNLSDTIERKFTDVINLEDWEIDTEDGWEDLKDVKETIPYEIWRAEFDNGLWLEGADNHIVILDSNEECFLKDLIPNQSRVRCREGITLCTSVFSKEDEDNMYDVGINSENHTYYTNDILSHNTITVGAFLMYQCIFNRDYTVAILANNATKSREILSRLKMMYENLPWWLKPGVVEWNKGSIEFSNGSKIFAGPTTPSSIRGYSISCLYLDEFSFVKDDVEFYTSTYPVISSGTTSKIIITSTPNGLNLFYKIFTDSQYGRNSYNNAKFIWSAHPNRDEAWKIETIKNTSIVQFRQEHRLRIFWEQ